MTLARGNPRHPTPDAHGSVPAIIIPTTATDRKKEYPMGLLGKAVLCVWNDVDPSIETDYNDWYRLEHIPERLSVPGMLRARRYRSDQGSPRYMALYEAASIDVLTSGAYRTQLANPTAWTRRIMPGFRLMQRGICDVMASGGAGPGDAATVIHFRPTEAAEPAIRTRVAELVASLLAAKSIAAAHAWRVAPGEPESPTTSLTRSTATERPVHWVVMAEADRIEELASVQEAVRAQDLPGDVIVYPASRLTSTVTVGE
jgi:hypothetical protein